MIYSTYRSSISLAVMAIAAASTGRSHPRGFASGDIAEYFKVFRSWRICHARPRRSILDPNPDVDNG